MALMTRSAGTGLRVPFSIWVLPLSNVAHVRQSRPDSGLDFTAHVLDTVLVVPSSLGSGLTL